MASTYLAPYASATITVPASSKLATYSAGNYQVLNKTLYANYPPALVSAFTGTGGNTTSAYTASTSVTIFNGSKPLRYNVGVGPVIYERDGYQPTPGTLNATGTLTAALILGGIVTSTTAAAVTATLDTGAIMDAALTMAADDAFDWTAINTGGSNAFTVTASSGHTIVGTAAVAANTSGRFRTRKTAASTFVTYRIA